MEEHFFTCEIHKQQFKTIDALKQHVLNDHSNEVQHHCEVCDERFKNKLQFQRHKREQHQELNRNTKTIPPSLSQLKQSTSPLIPTEQHDETITVAVQVKVEEEPSVNQFQCHICSEVLSGETILNQHLLSHLSDEPSLNSEIDETGFVKTENISERLANEDVKPIIDTATDIQSGSKSFSCKICKTKFQLRKVLNDHLKTHPKGKRLPFRCRICNQELKTRSARRKHVLNEHSESDVDFSDDTDYKPDVHPDSSEEDENSKIENASFLNDEDDKEEEDSSNFDKISDEKSQKPKTSRNHTAKNKFICYFCQRPWRLWRDHERHMWSHTKERPWQCKICKKNVYQQDIDRHMLTHSETRSHICKICNKGFKRGYSLKTHVRSSHSLETPFTCELCLKGFKRRDLFNLHLKRHERLGTQHLSQNRGPGITNPKTERSHRCELCSKMYTQLRGLRLHMQSVHSNKRPFKCRFCSKTYALKSVLNHHIKCKH